MARLAALARRVRRRASLGVEEWRDQAEEWRRHLASRQARWQQGLPRWRKGFSVNDACELAHARWREGIGRFDAAFNARWERLQDDAGRLKARLRERAASSSSASAHGWTRTASSSSTAGPPFDTTAMVLVGAGTGAVIEGYPLLAVLTAGGLVRGVSRFVMQRVDADDLRGLFRWVPRALCGDIQRRQEIFAYLRREITTFRALRAGDMTYADLSWIDKSGNREAMDPCWDHTPESLFHEAMISVSEHPRVRQTLGEPVRPEREPDKVVYRIHEGIAEVFLGWNVVGSVGSAEIQVKATASIVDFIYVFPRSKDRYGLQAAGFVIRPLGAWSLDCSELPRDQKRPFGGDAEGRLLRNREAVFEWDWTVREFRHGYEDHPRRQRAS